jgi:hypothetical protein
MYWGQTRPDGVLETDSSLMIYHQSLLQVDGALEAGLSGAFWSRLALVSGRRYYWAYGRHMYASLLEQEADTGPVCMVSRERILAPRHFRVMTRDRTESPRDSSEACTPRCSSGGRHRTGLHGKGHFRVGLRSVKRRYQGMM